MVRTGVYTHDKQKEESSIWVDCSMHLLFADKRNNNFSRVTMQVGEVVCIYVHLQVEGILVVSW